MVLHLQKPDGVLPWYLQQTVEKDEAQMKERLQQAAAQYICLPQQAHIRSTEERTHDTPTGSTLAHPASNVFPEATEVGNPLHVKTNDDSACSTGAQNTCKCSASQEHVVGRVHDHEHLGK